MNSAKKGCLTLLVLVGFIVGLTLFTSAILPKFGLAVLAPSVSLAPEVLIHDVVPGFNLTNGMISMIIVCFLVIAIMISTNRAIKKQGVERFVPTNTLTTILDWVVEFWDTQIQGLGRMLYRIMPLALTIFLFLAVSNLIKMIPGTETIGMKECAQVGQTGYPIHNGFLDTNHAGVVTEEMFEVCEKTGNGLFKIVPFVKPLATDINAPISIALVVFFSVQIWGVQALGGKYFFKFVNLPALGSGKFLDFIISAFEVITELMKPLSLAMRITFVIFAGGVILLVFGYLLGPIGALVFYVFELVIGLFQAFIFAILTLAYGAQAIAYHEE
jgi:F-type H+-transporting ATPase subunit a